MRAVLVLGGVWLFAIVVILVWFRAAAVAGRRVDDVMASRCPDELDPPDWVNGGES